MSRPAARDFAKSTWEQFEEDLASVAINPAVFDPAKADDYTRRLDALGKHFLYKWGWPLAEALYHDAAVRAAEFEQQTNKMRHRGLLLANEAVARIAQGNFEGAIVKLIEAAKEDQRTKGIPRAESFALQGLLENYYLTSARASALNRLQAISPQSTDDELKGFLASTKFAGLPVLAYLHRIAIHQNVLAEDDNEFSRSEILHGLRGLSGVIEVYLKEQATVVIAGTNRPNSTLGDALQNLFGGNPPVKPWFSGWTADKQNVGAANPAISISERFNSVDAFPQGTKEECYYKSVLTTLLVRNYTCHQDDFQTELVTSQLDRAIGRMLHVGVHFKDM